MATSLRRHTASELLPDDVWRSLDPAAARLRWPTVRRSLMRMSVAAVALLAVGVLVQSGVVLPQLSSDQRSGSYTSDPGARAFTHDLTVRNAGYSAVTLESVGRDGPGLTLTRVSGTFPLVLRPGGSATFALAYSVLDCSAVPRGAWPVPVRVRRPWGAMTRWLALPRQMPMTTPPSGLGQSSGSDVDTREWQEAHALDVCPVDPATGAPASGAPAAGAPAAGAPAAGTSPGDASQLGNYAYTCCLAAEIDAPRHPGETMQIHWLAPKGPEPATTVTVTLGARLVGPFADVGALKANPQSGTVYRADDLQAAVFPGGSPSSSIAIPADAAPGFYNLETTVTADGAEARGDSIIRVTRR